jgi:hypothetical protein
MKTCFAGTSANQQIYQAEKLDAPTVNSGLWRFSLLAELANLQPKYAADKTYTDYSKYGNIRHYSAHIPGNL